MVEGVLDDEVVIEFRGREDDWYTFCYETDDCYDTAETHVTLPVNAVRDRGPVRLGDGARDPRQRRPAGADLALQLEGQLPRLTPLTSGSRTAAGGDAGGRRPRPVR